MGRGRSNRFDDIDAPYTVSRDNQSGDIGSGLLYALMVIFFLVIGVTGWFLRTMPVIRSSGEPDREGDASSHIEQPVSSEEVDEETRRVEELLGNMTVEQKVGQLFMIRGKNDTIQDIAAKTNAGGAILFTENFKGLDADQVRALTSRLQGTSDIPMFIAVDEEGGTVVRVSRNPKLREHKFLSPQSLYEAGGMELIRADARNKCALLDSLGINMNMAPVADVCTSSKGFMYKRAFGKGPEETAGYVSAVVEEMNATNVLSCVKHFPGYGNSKADTHKGLDTNGKSLDELRACDLIPFEAAIAKGVPAIMLTHTVIKAVDPDRPGSLSPDVVRLLREDMAFDGLLISDGLEMGAINQYSGGDSGKVCVMAISAGVDILCAPKNPLLDYQAVLDAVNSGEIPMSRVDEAVRRILRAKMSMMN